MELLFTLLKIELQTTSCYISNIYLQWHLVQNNCMEKKVHTKVTFICGDSKTDRYVDLVIKPEFNMPDRLLYLNRNLETE